MKSKLRILESTVTVGFTDNVTVGGNLTISGNFTVNGTTTTVATTNTTVSDNLLELNSGAGSNANDSGILIERGSTGDNAIMAWDESIDKFVVGTTTATNTATGNLTITTGTLLANIEGNITATNVLGTNFKANDGTGFFRNRRFFWCSNFCWRCNRIKHGYTCCKRQFWLPL